MSESRRKPSASRRKVSDSRRKVSDSRRKVSEENAENALSSDSGLDENDNDNDAAETWSMDGNYGSDDFDSGIDENVSTLNSDVRDDGGDDGSSTSMFVVHAIQYTPANADANDSNNGSRYRYL